MNSEKEKLLKKLKAKYLKKYCLPLLSGYTNPPIIFDEFQIRLTKQIDKIMEKVEKAELCKKCNGNGVCFERIENFADKKVQLTWKQSLNDVRAVKNDFCLDCFGDGIVFHSDNNKMICCKSPLFVFPNQVKNVVCNTCHCKLFWEHNDEDDFSLVSYCCCHDNEYVLRARLFSLEVKN